MNEEQQNYVRRWLHSTLNSTKELTVADVREDIDWLYQLAKLTPPRDIIISNSYLEHHRAIRKGGDSTVSDKLYKSSIMQFFDEVETGKFWDKWDNGIFDPVFDEEHKRVIEPIQRYKIKEGESISQQIGLSTDLWMACYGHLIENGTISKNNAPNFLRYYDFLCKGIFDVCFFKETVYICRLPTKVIREADGRLGSIDQAAVQWKGHKGDCYFISSVAFDDPKVWEQIVTKKMPCKDVLALENIEQRYIALRMYGPEKLLDELDAKLINESKRGNKLYGISNVLQGRGADLVLKLLKYKDPSTDRVYASFVPYNIDKADAAMAWKFSIEESEYATLKLTNEG